MSQTVTDLLTGLNEQQQTAVTTTEGPVLVVAGPGSGKTRVLTHRIAYLIQHLGVHPSQILAVTFTNKAAREMRERIDKLIGEDATDGLTMGTFHSLGVRILRQNPGRVAEQLHLQSNFVIYDSGDQMELVRTAIKNANLDPKQVTPRRMLSRISAAKSVLQTSADVGAGAESYDDEIVARVYTEYEKLLRAANAVDFDDLLGLPIRLFDQDPSTLARYQHQYKYILVDEYQDTNRVQYVMVSALAEHYGNLFVVGDPDQSIYGWRQADITNILNFKEDYPATTEIHLEVNYRSTHRIVQAADRVISQNTERIDRKMTTSNDEGEMIQLRELSDQQHEATWIVSEIRRLVSMGKVLPEQIAVMYRTTAQSRVLEEAFRTSEFRYQIIGGVRFYERREVRDIMAVLRFLYNPADNVALLRMVDHLPIGKGFGPAAFEIATRWATEHQRPLLDAMLTQVPAIANKEDGPLPHFTGTGAKAAARIGTAFQLLRTKKQDSTLAELFDAIVDTMDVRKMFDSGTEEDLQRWANVQELRTDLERYDLVDPQEALTQYLEQVALISDADTMDDDNAGSVTLITLHSAKGLEYPVVFIAGAEEGLLPIYRAVEAEAFDNTAMEEERRLFYVGITRAMKILYITYAQSRMTHGQFRNGDLSRFLEPIPAESMRRMTRESHRTSNRPREYSRAASGSFTERAQTPWGDAPPVPKKIAPVIPDFKEGNTIFHPKFGEGMVDSVTERRDNDKEVTVSFKNSQHGTKRLMASLANMDIISQDIT